jgi:hypothetical protein
VYRGLVGKPQGKRPMGRPRRRCEDNIKMDLQEVRCGGIDWIELAQDTDSKYKYFTITISVRWLLEYCIQPKVEIVNVYVL